VPFLAYILTAVAAYLLGSIPTGFLVGRAKGVDIRTVGSKNMGATNVFRTLGKGPGILVLVVDGLKGFAAVAWLTPVIITFFNVPDDQVHTLRVVAGISAVLGHNYTCWLAFKGGKGIATTAGAYFALAPLSVGIALVVWIILFFATRYVSVASIGAAVALPAAVWITQPSLLLSLVTTGLGAMAIYKHKANIQRLIAGTENRIHFKKEKPAA
jgi:acyl phosphate:glycerol-3-phosphate acyltransferase